MTDDEILKSAGEVAAAVGGRAGAALFADIGAHCSPEILKLWADVAAEPAKAPSYGAIGAYGREHLPKA